MDGLQRASRTLTVWLASGTALLVTGVVAMVFAHDGLRVVVGIPFVLSGACIAGISAAGRSYARQLIARKAAPRPVGSHGQSVVALPAPDRSDRMFNGPMRTLQYVGLMCILLAATQLAIVVGRGWAWGPFVIALVIVAVGAVINALLERVALGHLQPSTDELHRIAVRRHVRNPVVVPSYVTFAAAGGLVAGSLRSYWVDATVGGIWLAVTVLLPVALLPRLRRRIPGDKLADRPNSGR